MNVGNRVMRIGWKDHPGADYLARLGRVTRIAGPRTVEVRWDSADESALGGSAPAVRKLEQIEDLTWLWWRST